MRKLRTIVAAATACVLGLAAAGCGSGSSSSSTASGSTITYWASNQGTSLDNDKEVLTPLLDEFTKQTGVKVNLEVIGWNDLQTRIQTAITSGQGPDVLNIGNTWGVSLQATGGLMEFGDSEMKAIGGSDRFVQAALETGGAPGTTPTSVPLYGLAYGLYYNKAMFQQAGLTPPASWEEMVDDAKKLTNPATGVYGMTLAAGSYTENAHFAFINAAQNGAELFDSSGKPTFTQDGVVNGVSRYLDLMQTDKVVNPSDAQFTDGSKSIAAFANKKAAMIINQNNANATLISNGMSEDEWGVVPLPAPQNAASQVASHVAGINIAIMKSTKNKDAALQFVKFMTSQSTQEALGKPFSSLPVLKDAKATFTTNAEELKTFTDIYNNRSKPLPLVPNEDQFESTVGKAMNNMFASIATGSNLTPDQVRNQLNTAQTSITS
ncbi:multiple sugar transport system substrate-binding protein [Propionibacterium cyclohexanicum]|uniref:Multiple sugar transport system substrate-binding protein n=1 Tax=Propionibacterium cyclohexanicum TaxID=64702 RepID=A0A1H9SNL4_9ACTN|nr:sugar ABC transporter substrate-binding protein [Propionibacterium cyclohexanicum]SER86602.1 multiple sugar transport system substrate-binding protein [Propionibacterium cyclohexanicum]